MRQGAKAKEIQDHVKAVIAPYKYPRAIEFIEALPRPRRARCSASGSASNEQVSGPEATITRRIDWIDTDASGHWHNATILRFLEAAEDALHEKLGMPELFGHVPRVQLHIDFASRLWFRDEPTTRIWVDSVGTSSMTYGFEVTLGDRGVASGTKAPSNQADPDGEGSKPWTDEQRAGFHGTRP